MHTYPIVALLILMLRELTFKFTLWQQTFLLTMILVPMIILIIAPKVSVELNE